MPQLYTYLLLILLFLNTATAQIKLCSWNVENIGKSKTEADIEFMANVLRDFDVVALQEVVAGYGGSQAVARLADALNRKGSKWDYIVSNPTTGSSYKKERYAFYGKPGLCSLKGYHGWKKKFQTQIDREPFYATFKVGTKEFTLANFHAITKSKQPEKEIKYFKYLPALYPNLNLLFLGDFNCPQSHSVFFPLKNMGYASAFRNQKTSLKKTCKKNNCLASEFDNIWYNTRKISVAYSQAIHFYRRFPTLEKAREISDHIPVSIWFSLN